MADKNIKITVADKRAKLVGTPVIVCGNSDYTVTFTFDDEWAGLAGELKTARFVYIRDGVQQYEDMVFSGNTVAVPVLADVAFVSIGVYMGNLSTTTPARVLCTPSILCGTGAAQGLTEDIYNQLLAAINALVEKGASGATEEQVQQIEQNRQGVEQNRQSIDAMVNGDVSAGKADAVPWEGISDKPNAFTPASHKHTTSDISNFPTAMTPTAHNQSASTITTGTFGGRITANANTVAVLGDKQVRNIYAGTAELTAGTSALPSGDIYFQIKS